MWRRQAFVTLPRSTKYWRHAKKVAPQPPDWSWSPDPCNRAYWSVCIQTEVITQVHFGERQQRWCLQAIPPPPRLTDLQQLSFLVHRGTPACCLAVINERQFQGSLPWRSAGAVWWRSVTDYRVINCGDGEQAISMQRCSPPDRSIPRSRFSHSGNHSFTVGAAGLCRGLSVEISCANMVSSSSPLLFKDSLLQASVALKLVTFTTTTVTGYLLSPDLTVISCHQLLSLFSLLG